MGASFRIGRLLGIPIEINASWGIVFLLLTFLLAQEFGDSRLRWPVAQRWTVAIAMTVFFFMSVLAHELSHSVLAKRQGIPVHGITLFIFGGVSRLSREPDGPWKEFLIAVIGPVSSLILAGIFGGVWYALGSGDSTLEVMLILLAWSNFSLGVFNILPGYPLDGGRVLRAAVWGLTGSHTKATRVASRAGQALGAAAVVLGIVIGLMLEPLNGIWIAIVGSFLFSVATASLREARPGIEAQSLSNHAG
ncbi:MAG: hypothetical protein BZY81_06345 [SAR202 cluster bacterium Io17-Chloro-G4]|nr:MAG: hypothetical protein BZY81_06345 [SAR202 cluster bacterium Io17-Chloro-G4]